MMNAKSDISVKIYQVGLSRIRETYIVKIPTDMKMKDLYELIAKKSGTRKGMIAATIEAHDPSKIGRYRYPGRIFTSDNPDGCPKFQLDTSNAEKTISECNITDGAELMYNNGEMD